MKYTFCTLFNKDYLPRALVLYRSLLKVTSDFELWILCMDNLTWEILTKMKLANVRLVSLKDFEDRSLKKAKKNRDFREYCWTCASNFTWYVLKHSPGSKYVAYLDADLCFYSSVEPIYKEMAKNSVLIIPHWIVPGKRQKEKLTGKYNVGMVIFKNDLKGKKCLDWWRKSCLKWCYFRYENGKFADQKYLDDFPVKFSGVHVLKNRGAGVAPWNISQYKVEARKGGIYINNQPLIFYHFQGLDTYSPGRNLYGLLYSHYLRELDFSYRLIQHYYTGFNYGFTKTPGIFKIYWRKLVMGLLKLRA